MRHQDLHDKSGPGGARGESRPGYRPGGYPPHKIITTTSTTSQPECTTMHPLPLIELMESTKLIHTRGPPATMVLRTMGLILAMGTTLCAGTPHTQSVWS